MRWPLILLLIVAVPLAQGRNTLLLVQTIYNHGSHTPLYVLPGDHRNNASAWEDGLGALTNKGMKEAFALGSSIRRRYNRGFNLFSHSMMKEVHALSADTNLALTTAYVTMAGLMSEGRSFSWKPFPVHSDRDDISLRSDANCPQANTIVKTEVFKSDALKSLRNMSFLRQLVANSGLGKLRDIGQLHAIYDALTAILHTKKKLPRWATENDIELLRELINSMLEPAYTEKVLRLRSGSLMRRIVEQLRAKISCRAVNTKVCDDTKNVKMFTYSTDDLTLYALMRAFGARLDGLPASSTVMTIELWQNRENGEYEVKALRKELKMSRFADIMISGCPSVVCPMETFAKRSEPFIPIDIEEECGMKQKANHGHNQGQQGSFSHSLDCAYEKDQSSTKNCYDWAVADYCEKQAAVKYLFCRKTCQCNPKFARRAQRFTAQVLA